MQTANFGFLDVHDAKLLQLGALAERYFRDDPSTCLIKLRQFAELIAKSPRIMPSMSTSERRSRRRCVASAMTASSPGKLPTGGMSETESAS